VTVNSWMMIVEITDMVHAATCKYRTIPKMTDETMPLQSKWPSPHDIPEVDGLMSVVALECCRSGRPVRK